MIGIALVVDHRRLGAKLVFRYPAPPSEGAGESDQFHSFEDDFFAKLMCPKAAICNPSFELVIDHLTYVSHPVDTSDLQVVSPSRDSVTDPAGNSRDAGEVDSSSNTDGVAASGSAVKSDDMTLFNVVFVISNRKRGRNGVGAPDFSGFKRAASALALALKREQRRCGYVSEQVQLMLRTKDELQQQQQQQQQKARQTAQQQQRQLPEAQESFAALLVVLERSRLASELKEVFHGLQSDSDGASTDRFVQVYLNGWMRLVLSLEVNANGPAGLAQRRSPDAQSNGHDLGTAAAASSHTASPLTKGAHSSQALIAQCRPYHTLLLLQEEAVRATRK
jgi:hypothetical protein